MSEYVSSASASPRLPDIQVLETQFIDCGAAEQQLFTTFDVDGGAEELRAAADDRRAQKELFLSGQVRNPRLNQAPKFKTQRTERGSVSAAVDEIERTQILRRAAALPITPGDVALNELIEMRKTEHVGVEAAAELAASRNSTMPRSEAARLLKTTMRAAYGMPREETAVAVLASRYHLARQIDADKDHPLQSVARGALTVVQAPDMSAEDAAEVLGGMSQRSIVHYQQIMLRICAPAIDYAFKEVGDKTTYSVQDMLDISTRYLTARGLAEQGVSAEIVPNRTTSLASMSDMALLIGEQRSEKMRSKQQITNTLLHEGEVHLRRMARARAGGMRLAGYALARANVFEEPFAATATANLQGKGNHTGESYTAAIALSAGYDGGSERDFRDSHEALWRLNLLTSFNSDKPLADQVTSARSAAHASLVRIWRGMPTDEPGVVMPRDHAYDNRAVLKYLDIGGEVLPEDEFLALFDSRHDPTLPHHQAYIDWVKQS